MQPVSGVDLTARAPSAAAAAAAVYFSPSTDVHPAVVSQIAVLNEQVARCLEVLVEPEYMQVHSGSWCLINSRIFWCIGYYEKYLVSFFLYRECVQLIDYM